ncbi:calcium proton exchanger [Melanogaster broomeanus]|nr:calcium proton exchanger [Melanogaster broomeanus]
MDSSSLTLVNEERLPESPHAYKLREETLPLSPGPSGVNGRRSTSGRQRTKTVLMERAASLLQPKKKVGPPPTVWKSIRAIILASYLNLLLICIPISWALNFALPDQHTIIFVFAFLAIIPLAKLLAFATDELSIRVGQTLAGLMNATLGNAVELIVSIIALTKCELEIVQSSLIGSILSNLLLVLGMCFFAGGLRFSEQGFGMSAAQMNSSLLTISVIAVLLPGAFLMALEGQTNYDATATGEEILKMSHGVAIILLFIYGGYLVFQLFSHKGLYQDDSLRGGSVMANSPNLPPLLARRWFTPLLPLLGWGISISKLNDTTVANYSDPASSDPESGHHIPQMEMKDDEDEDIEEPQMSVAVSIGLLASVTVLVAVTAEFLVDSINGLTESGTISQQFVGVILLPIVGNAAEHVTAVTVSVKDKLTLSLGVAVGSSIQIALFVIPFIVTLAWALGKPLTLLFDPFQSVTLFLSVLTVNYVVQDGKSNWLEGFILICLYLILAVSFWFYPGTDPILSCT